MATIDTTYRVISEYTVKDRTKPGTNSMVHNLDKVERKGLGLKRALLGLGAAIGVGGAFALGKKYLIDYNSNLEQTKIQTASLLSLYKGGDVVGNMKVANNIVGELRKRAAASTATTEEMADFMGRIVGPATKAGLATKDIANFTADSVIAAKLFGEEMTAGLDIKQALNGQVTVKDRFANQLLDIAKVEKEAFNQMAAGDRLKVLQQALKSPVIAQAAKAQGESFMGLTSTLKDNIQQALGQVGVPLMKELTATAKEMVDYLGSGEGIAATKEFAKSFADGLVTGFKAVKSIVGFIVEHKDLLLTIGKLWLAGKAVKGAAGLVGMVGKLGGGVTGVLGKLGGGLQVLAGKLPFANAQLGIFGMKIQAMAPGIGSFIGKLGGAAAALGLLYVAASAFADWVDKKQTESIAQQVNASSLRNTIEQGSGVGDFSKGKRLEQRAKMLGYDSGQELLDQQARRARADLEKAGLIKDGKANRKAIFKQLGPDYGGLQEDRINRIINRSKAADTKDMASQTAVRVANGLEKLASSLPAVEMARRIHNDNLAAQFKNTISQIPGYLDRHAKDLDMVMGAGSFVKAIAAAMGRDLGNLGGKFKKLTRSPVSVKIEIPARDPDVFARQFNDAMEQIAAMPTAAAGIIGSTF